MRVELTIPPGLIADGILERIVSEQGTPYPHIVIEMKVTGLDNPVKVTLDLNDLSTIARLARGSNVREIRDALR
jgi:hypothetical protein